MRALIFTGAIYCWYDWGMEPVSAIIQAGGQSRRMGRDKALIDYHGRPILAHVIDTLRQLSDDVIVVSNRSDVYGPFGARVVPDYDPPSGPLGGLAAGLAAMQHDLAVVVACDMPFLNLDLFRFMIERAAACDAVVPLTGDQYEPLHAVYRRTCLAAIQRRLANDERRVISFFQDVRLSTVPEADWRVIDPDGRSLSNLNTPADLKLLT
jgi:molybdopterin-guanine dinucleotide biosynthesis protein A